MNQEEFIKDDILRKVIRDIPLDSPSEDFEKRIMDAINVSTETSQVHRSLFTKFLNYLPYLGVVAILILFLVTSDLSVGKYFPGKDYFVNLLAPYLTMMASGFNSLLSSSYVIFGLGIGASAGFLMLIDHIFDRRISMHHPAV